MSEKPNVESEKEEAEFRSFMLSTIRGPPKSGVEGLIASELGLAVLSMDYLSKIRHAFEAFLLVEVKEPILTAAGLSQDEVEMLYQSCLGLSQMHTLWGGAHVPWPFPEALAPKMLKWFALIYDQLLPDGRRDEIMNRLKMGDPETWSDYLRVVYRYSSALCHPSFAYTLRSYFISVAMPKAMKLMGAILEHLVPKELWEATLALLRGGRREARGHEASDRVG